MVDVDTFLTTLYVIVDDFCHSQAPKKRPGSEASLSRSEVLTLAIFARWNRFNSERDFYRYADTKLRNAFPTLPDRSQFNRLVRSCTELIETFALHLVSLLRDARHKHPYQALDSSAMPIRDCKRRGHGWLAGCADIGWSNSLKRSWSKRLRRWVASIRQIVESVYDKLFNAFGLWRERPHELEGLQARLAARVALHNFCIWLNDQLGQPRLAFADLLGW
jgi:hypothetical protein